MPISPINIAMIQRTDDVGFLHHQQENKPHVDQQNIQVQVQHQEEVRSQQVVTSQNSEKMKNDADAKEEGRGAYSGNPKQKRSSKQVTQDRVIRKQSKGFDIKI